MYVNKNKLVHLLQPEHYREPDCFIREKEQLFEPAWQFVAAIDEIPNHGDFLTTTILDLPLLVRNHEGTPHVYLNVCGHRHSRLTSEKCGNCDTIRCQYHGWEYKPDGSTGKIPDANCFRPFDRENAHLKCFQTVLCGRLIFAAFSDRAPDFESHMGARKAIIENWFDGDVYRFGKRMTYEIDANWKIAVENTLESYHVPHLHGDTIGDHPPEKDQEHEFGENYSSLFTSEPKTLNRQIQDVLLRLLGVTPNHKYTHHLVYPNFMMIGLDPMTMVQTYIPTSATTHRWEGLVFVRSATSPPRKPFEWLSSPIIKLGAKMVVEEDTPIYQEVQQGIKHSAHPGVIGTIEERIFAFQEFVLHHCEGREIEQSEAWKKHSDTASLQT